MAPKEKAVVCSTEDLRAIIRDETQPILDKVNRLEVRLFIGTPERPSLQEDVAVVRAEHRALHSDVARLKTTGGSGDFWKKILAIVLALITTAGGLWGVAQVGPNSNNSSSQDGPGQE